jgi:hypothetical protein
MQEVDGSIPSSSTNSLSAGNVLLMFPGDQ